MSTVGSPPAADTRCRPVADESVAKMIVPSGPHVAPRGPPPSTAPIVTGGPPVIATFLIVEFRRKTRPTVRPAR